MVVLVCVAVVVDGDNNNTSSRVYAGKMIFQLRQKLSWIKKSACSYISYLCTNTMWLRTLTYCFKIRCCWEMKRERDEMSLFGIGADAGAMLFIFELKIHLCMLHKQLRIIQNSLPNWKWPTMIVFSVVLMCLCNRGVLCEGSNKTIYLLYKFHTFAQKQGQFLS